MCADEGTHCLVVGVYKEGSGTLKTDDQTMGERTSQQPVESVNYFIMADVFSTLGFLLWQNVKCFCLHLPDALYLPLWDISSTLLCIHIVSFFFCCCTGGKEGGPSVSSPWWDRKASDSCVTRPGHDCWHRILSIHCWGEGQSQSQEQEGPSHTAHLAHYERQIRHVPEIVSGW